MLFRWTKSCKTYVIARSWYCTKNVNKTKTLEIQPVQNINIFICTNFNDHQFGILDPVSQKSKATNLIDLLHGLTKKQSAGF